MIIMLNQKSFLHLVSYIPVNIIVSIKYVWCNGKGYKCVEQSLNHLFCQQEMKKMHHSSGLLPFNTEIKLALWLY